MKKLKPRRFNRSKKSLKNKILSVFLVLIMVFGMIPKQVYSNNYKNVEIKDENLIKALKEEIKEVNPDYNEEYISKEDMELLIDIDLSNRGIKSLEGLENGVNLKDINLKGNKISDISPLNGLNKLENLDVSDQKIEIKGIKSINEEVTIENPLVGLNKEVIKNIHGESIELVDNSIKVSGISENKLVEINFNESYDNKIFSGKILLEITKEDEKIEQDENIEKEDIESDIENNEVKHSKNIKKSERAIISANDNINLSGNFHNTGISSQSGFPNSAVKDDEIININYNSIKIGDKRIASSDVRRNQQTGVSTSKYKLDFNRSFELQGNLKMSAAPDGMAVVFHNIKDLEADKSGGYFGLHNHKTLRRGIGVEIDSYHNGSNNPSYGDTSSMPNKHIAINRIDDRYNSGHVQSLQYKQLVDADFDALSGKNFKISWDSQSNKLSLSYNGKSVERTFSDADLKYYFGEDKKSYVSFGGTVNFSWAGSNDIIITMEEIDYTDTDVNYNLNFYIEKSDGSEVLVNDLNKIKEEDKVIVRYKIKNNINTKELESKIKLEMNQLYGRKINVINDNTIKWYEPYIIKDSFKTYIGSGNINDGSIDINKFFAGEEVNFKLPSNSQTRTIEYKIQMPKIVKNKADIVQVFNFYNEGMESHKVMSQSNINGSEPINFNDQNLNNGLIFNIKNSINESRPPELEGNAYEKELHALENINLSQRGIGNLDGIEKCINTKSIDLSKNEISNIEPLTELKELTKLNLSNTKISNNLNPLSKLSKLNELDLSENEISDVDPLSKLEGLTKLNLSNNKIADNLNPLSGLSKLSELDLSFNGISKIDSLATLSGLTNLNLNNNHINDISSLKNMSSTIYTIMNQSINTKNYINTDDFVFDNIIIGSDGKRVNNVWTTGNYNGQYNPLTGKITWTGLSNDTIHNLEYEWEDTNYQGKVCIEVDQVKSPDYMVMIPSNIEMGDIKDEGQVGAEEFISMVSEKNISGEIKIYTDSEFTITNTKNSEDKARVFVYKTFEDRLKGNGNDKVEPLVSLNNENKEDNFIIKSPISNFKHNNVEYKGTMKFIIEHVN
ncbi:leucine-rich repeat domain-containing protein [Paraclostridium ghonii]|uniref:leucine-rich repeat domain-containing protein n=1 Tax=Paraclostridium ghonii TaxID=29358 RepID=UPI00202CEEF4|nr:leucine-rich repeat domain-containing protein [Paeniclostridium ghonii]MCM0166149.1 leucine-rich repeat domain-containing protein [Paeniclostridium ghonii]